MLGKQIEFSWLFYLLKCEHFRGTLFIKTTPTFCFFSFLVFLFLFLSFFLPGTSSHLWLWKELHIVTPRPVLMNWEKSKIMLKWVWLTTWVWVQRFLYPIWLSQLLLYSNCTFVDKDLGLCSLSHLMSQRWIIQMITTVIYCSLSITTLFHWLAMEQFWICLIFGLCAYFILLLATNPSGLYLFETPL